MSLLAEPRRKQVVSSNPQGKGSTEGWQEFGKKLMKKAGWQDGDGLGSDRQGNTDPLLMQFKDDTKGVGFTKSHEQNWLAHNDDFNALLSSLNQNYSEYVSAVAAPPDDQPPVERVCLEKKSKNARGRIHYHKFTRGKDLSSRSSAEMSSIFGGRVPAKNGECNRPVLDGLTEDVVIAIDHTKVTGLHTTESKESIHEYFSKKMLHLKRKAKQEGGGTTKETESEDCGPGTTQSSENVESAINEVGASVPDDLFKGQELQDYPPITTNNEVTTEEMLIEPRKSRKRSRVVDENICEMGNGDATNGHVLHLENPEVLDDPVVIITSDAAEPTMKPIRRRRKSRLVEISAAPQGGDDSRSPGSSEMAQGVQDASEKKRQDRKKKFRPAIPELGTSEDTEVDQELAAKKAAKKIRKAERNARESEEVGMTSNRLDGADGVTANCDDAVVAAATPSESIEPAKQIKPVPESTTNGRMFSQTPFGLSINGIRHQLRNLSDQQKSQIFPGSNVFDITGYGDNRFF